MPKAISRQSLRFADQMAGVGRQRSLRADDRLEGLARRLARRTPRLTPAPLPEELPGTLLLALSGRRADVQVLSPVRTTDAIEATPPDSPTYAGL